MPAVMMRTSWTVRSSFSPLKPGASTPGHRLGEHDADDDEHAGEPRQQPGDRPGETAGVLLPVLGQRVGGRRG